MIEETEKVLQERLEALVKDLPPAECDKLLVEMAEYVMMAKYGIVMSDSIKKMTVRPHSNTTTIQSFNDGKAVLISPKGYEIVSEENVGSNGCYRVTMRENKRSSFEDSPDRKRNIPHLERGGFISRYKGRQH